jgi:multidrug efflux pump subunit AcrA (membrane-fusion protein)
MSKNRKRYRRQAIVFFCWALGVLILAGGVLLYAQTLRSEHAHQATPGEGEVQHSETSIHTETHDQPVGSSHSESHGIEEMGKTGDESGRIVTLTPEAARLSDIKTAPVQYRRLAKEIQTVGEIAYDERRVKVVSAWIGGRIDKLYVDFTGIEVKKGEPLAELYSPELVSTQQEYILALETKEMMESGGNEEAIRSAEHLLNATRLRLQLWGISEEQIDQMEKTWRINPQMTIHAPIGGIVIHKRRGPIRQDRRGALHNI